MTKKDVVKLLAGITAVLKGLDANWRSANTERERDLVYSAYLAGKVDGIELALTVLAQKP
ncbi:MAG: hypothetical protein WCO84_07085 [bacterium]